MQTLAYGPGPDQAGDLYLPDTSQASLVCLFHGGFWSMPYGRDQLHPLADRLCTDGFAVWNVGYRRTGPDGHQWPATLQDVRAAITYLPHLYHSTPEVNPRRLFLVGHSAGGHLGFWAASIAKAVAPFPPTGVIGLAPLLDLNAASKANLGGGAVDRFLGGSPTLVPERYQEASPRALLPLGVEQHILHGEADTVVPPRFSQAYVTAAVAAGDEITYSVFRGTDHMSLIDPASGTYAPLLKCLKSAA